MKNLLILGFIILSPLSVPAQGMNNTWLLGNDPGWPNIGRMIFDNNSYQLLSEQRKMAFKGTQATISDNQGNFLMSSNGVWIANATNDTMMNGSGLNPGYFVNSWSDGLIIDNGNLFIPFPGDTNKYVLFHQTRLDQNSYLGGIYKTLINISLDSGLGAVIDKNDTLILDQLTWGITACKHGNGRDWWIIAQKDSSDSLYRILFTPNGLDSIVPISIGYAPFAAGNSNQIIFSSDGSKIAQTNYDNPITRNSSIIIADFDRCTGAFSNTQTIQLTSGNYLWGLAFSPSGDYVYACNSGFIFQINSNTLTVDTVATYDGFISGFPPSCCATTFYNMYLAANGKIYITSGSSVQHLHEMNFPDSAGFSCDVQQHIISLGNYFHLRAVPNHPNYYLGALAGSPCDSLTGIAQLTEFDFNFSVSPNPNNGNFKISYLLPQNEKGKLEIFDINGRKVFDLALPEWSTMQTIILPTTIASGIYNCSITSANERVHMKIVMINEN